MKRLIALLSLGFALAASAADVPLIDADEPMFGWSFGRGEEFPGAKGSLKAAEDVAAQRRPALALAADFTGGGNYVQMGRRIDPVDVDSLSLWVKAPKGADGFTLRLIDGTAIRVRADWDHPCGLPIAETVESNGVKVELEAEGLAAVRAENGQVVALAAGGLRRVAGPGLALALDRPEDVVILNIDGEWHGIWQTADANGPVPAPLAALTSHWMRLILPSHLAR